jgi:hypothetical protein
MGWVVLRTLRVMTAIADGFRTGVQRDLWELSTLLVPGEYGWQVARIVLEC